MCVRDKASSFSEGSHHMNIKWAAVMSLLNRRNTSALLESLSCAGLYNKSLQPGCMRYPTYKLNKDSSLQWQRISNC